MADSKRREIEDSSFTMGYYAGLREYETLCLTDLRKHKRRARIALQKVREKQERDDA